MENAVKNNRFNKIDKYKNQPVAYFFIFPSFIILGLFLIWPAFWAFIASFKSIKPLMMLNTGIFVVPGKFIGINNYIKAIKDPLFIKSVLNTTYFSIIFIPLTMFISLFLSILFNQQLRGIKIVKTIFFMPYVFSIVSVSLIFMMLFNGDKGLINGLINFILPGLKAPNWLSNPFLAMPVISIMSVWRRIGYFMLIYSAALQSIPSELYESVEIEGGNIIQKFIYITWPFLKKINFVVLILLIVNALTIFQEVFVMTGGGPANSTITVTFLVYGEAFKSSNLGLASAMSYLLFIMVFIIAIIQNKITEKSSDF